MYYDAFNSTITRKSAANKGPYLYRIACDLAKTYEKMSGIPWRNFIENSPELTQFV